MEGWVREARNRLKQKYKIAWRYRGQQLDWTKFELQLDPDEYASIKNSLSFNGHAEQWQLVHFQTMMKSVEVGEEWHERAAKWRMEAEERKAQ